MTNFEKYKDEILEIDRKGYPLAKKSGKLTECRKIRCADCDFKHDCRTNFIKWLCAEAAPTLTKRERIFCEIMGEGYIARDEDGTLFYSQNKRPYKEYRTWGIGSSNYATLRSDIFKFITWEDEEPWAVEDLLKLEVEEWD
ncbi:MAG: hypothetical protein ACLSU9_10940 [Anaerovoracaceae bacterium]